MAFALIILSSCISLVEGICIKKYNSRRSEGGFAFTGLISLFAMLFFCFKNTGGFQFPSGLWGYGILAGIMYCSASFLTYLALQYGSFALSMLILSYSLVFSVGYGLIFLQEPATVYTYLGLGLVMISLYLTRGEKKESDKSFSVKWLICIVLSAAGSGMFSVCMRMQQIRYNDACSDEFMIIALGFSAIVLLMVGFIKDRRGFKVIIKYGSFYAIGAGVSNGIANMLGLVVTMLIPISLSAPVSAGVKMVLSFIVSIGWW